MTHETDAIAWFRIAFTKWVRMSTTGISRTPSVCEGYRALYRYGIMSHIDYYRENEYITTGGLGRYDREFRDSWTWRFIVIWGRCRSERARTEPISGFAHKPTCPTNPSAWQNR